VGPAFQPKKRDILQFAKAAAQEIQPLVPSEPTSQRDLSQPRSARLGNPPPEPVAVQTSSAASAAGVGAGVGVGGAPLAGFNFSAEPVANTDRTTDGRPLSGRGQQRTPPRRGAFWRSTSARQQPRTAQQDYQQENQENIRSSFENPGGDQTTEKNKVGKTLFHDTAGADNKKWTDWHNLVDKRTLGGHYEFVPLFLPSDDCVPDADQQDYDAIFADRLHNRRPSEPAHPRLKERPPSATTAFADRALRLREGRGARSALMVKEPVPAEFKHSISCPCPVCQPQVKHAAGVPSHDVVYNKVPACAKDYPPPASPPFWEREGFNFAVQGLDSGRVGPALKNEAPTAEDLDQLSRCLGRKGKVPANINELMASGASELDGRPRAGTYDTEKYAHLPEHRGRLRQAWQSVNNGEGPRSGVSMIFTPREDDPPIPNRVSTCRKAEGVFREQFSEDTERIVRNQNQANYRFASSTPPRGRSQPPPAPSFAGEHAGQPSGIANHQFYDSGDCVSGRGKEPDLFPLGKRCMSRGHRSFRQNMGNESTAMAFLTNHDRVAESFEREKEWRLQTDDAFRDLCGKTEELVLSARSCATAFRANGHVTSDLLKSHFVWEG